MPTLTFDFLILNKMGTRACHVLSTWQVWWWYAQWFSF